MIPLLSNLLNLARMVGPIFIINTVTDQTWYELHLIWKFLWLHIDRMDADILHLPKERNGSFLGIFIDFFQMSPVPSIVIGIVSSTQLIGIFNGEHISRELEFVIVLSVFDHFFLVLYSL